MPAYLLPIDVPKCVKRVHRDRSRQYERSAISIVEHERTVTYILVAARPPNLLNPSRNRVVCVLASAPPEGQEEGCHRSQQSYLNYPRQSRCGSLPRAHFNTHIETGASERILHSFDMPWRGRPVELHRLRDIAHMKDDRTTIADADQLAFRGQMSLASGGPPTSGAGGRSYSVRIAAARRAARESR